MLIVCLKKLIYKYILNDLYLDFQDKVNTLSNEYNTLSNRISNLEIKLKKRT